MKRRVKGSPYTPTEPQARFRELVRDPRYRFIAWVAGLRGGKTYGLARVVVQYALEHATRTEPFCVAAPTNEMLRDTIGLYVMEQARPFAKSYHKTHKILTLVTGGKIYFRSCFEPDSLRGPTYCGFAIDEASLTTQLAFDVLKGRLLTTGGKGFLATTPKGHNWLYDEFFDEDKDVDRSDYAWMRSSTYENDYVLESVVKGLEAQYSARFAEQELHAEFLSLSGGVYPEFDRAHNVIDYKIDPNKPISIGFDPGLRHPAIVGFQEVKPGVDVICMEWSKPNSRMDTIIATLGPMQSQISEICADPAGDSQNSQTYRSDLGLLRDAGFFVKSRMPLKYRLISPGVALVAGRYCNMQGQRRLLVSRTCTRTISDITRYSYPETKDGKKLVDEPLKDGKSDHGNDAIRYWVAMTYGMSTWENVA